LTKHGLQWSNFIIIFQFRINYAYPEKLLGQIADVIAFTESSAWDAVVRGQKFVYKGNLGKG
jgi:hypothetical protein